ncbi:MAG: AbrB family transcriptional regulator [Phycisphaerae bacterium]
MEQPLIVLALGVAGGVIARTVRLPGGALVGAMLASGVYSLLAGAHPLPQWVRPVAMILVGISLGAAINREALWKARRALPPAAVLAVLYSGLSIILGMGLHLFAPEGMTLATAVMGSLPGGASTTMAMAEDLGADIKVVAALNLVRQAIIVSLLPIVLGIIIKRRKTAAVATAQECSADQDSQK